jgi:hypothetical protein
MTTKRSKRAKRRAHSRPRRIKTRRNPEEASEAALELFRAFHKRDPDDDELREVSLAGEVPALEVGQLVAVIYRLGVGEPFTHEFDASARPNLLVSYDGHQLFIVGGDYQFTARGIEG